MTLVTGGRVSSRAGYSGRVSSASALIGAGSSTFSTPGEHEVLVFFVQILVLLLVARALGGLMRRIGQPAVIGELGAGLLLGPSILGALFPSAFAWLFPADEVQSAMLFTVGWLGVTFLLIATGFETDLGLIRSLGRAAVFVAAGSLLVPFAMGIGTGLLMPDTFAGDTASTVVFALFIGTSLSISSLPVIAKVLSDLGLMRRNFGQVTLAAGMANDLVGWIALGVIAGLAQSGGVSMSHLAGMFLGVVAFLALAFTLGQRAVDGLLRVLRVRSSGMTGVLSAVMVTALAAGVFTQALGVEAVLGAFVAGIVLGRSRFEQPEVRHHLDTLTNGIFAPIFFATAGLRVDLGVVARPEVAIWAVVVLAVASLSKFVGAIAGAGLAGLPRREGAALGVGLNARGALEIVIATVGLGLGVLNDAGYAVVVLMAMATSMMAPPMLRAIVSNWQGTPEEQQRLEQEERLSANVVVRPSRLLVPSRGGANSVAAARFAHLVWPEDVPATVLSVSDQDAPVEPPEHVLAVFGDRDVEHARARMDDVGEALAREALLGYGAMVVGADRTGPDTVLTPLVDRVLLSVPIPLVVVRSARNDEPPDGRFRRVLVPVTGTRFSRAAIEVGLGAAQRLNAEAILVHVITTAPTPALAMAGVPGRRVGASSATTGAPGSPDVADSFLARAARTADEMGVFARRIVREGASPGDEIVKAARELRADLVVVGANVRSAEGRPFLGHNVERVLDDAEMTVAVVAIPPDEAADT